MHKQLPWERPFLAALSRHGIFARAARESGVGRSTAVARRATDPAFARRCAKAMPAPAVRKAAVGAARRLGPGHPRAHWRKLFLEALAETSNVKASAALANISTDRVYRARRRQPEFARQWRTALREGFDNLEIELLGYLRDPQPDRKMDVAAAVRLLAAHRATVERERAPDEEEDVRAVRASLNRFIDAIRVNRAANAPLLEARRADDEE